MTRILLIALAAIPLVNGQNLSGLWDSTVTLNGLTVPFRMEISSQGATARGSFFNGEDRFPSTLGRFENGKLHLEFNYYTATLDAELKDGALQGSYDRPERGAMRHYVFQARPHLDLPAAAGAPNIDGAWELAVKSGKGEQAWHYLVRQKGAHIDSSILRVDGDTGTLSGDWKDDHFTISHFSGARAAILTVTPQPDGSLKLSQDGIGGKSEYTALRPAVARAKGLAPPDDPMAHTGVKDPSEPFHFKFKDLNGNIVSDTDAKFKGKVVVVNILGSWCPNCHDEAPFLAELYKKYRAKGVEVVALSFEEGDENVANPVQLRNFVKRYGIEYTVLVPGNNQQANDRLPQMQNFNAWPTTFFLGKDGRVARVHAGFPSSASGEMFEHAKAEFTATVEDLLHPAEAHGCVIEPPTIVAAAKKTPDCLK
jgi:thiol-disulfide isomerase/thioredoxin